MNSTQPIIPMDMETDIKKSPDITNTVKTNSGNHKSTKNTKNTKKLGYKKLTGWLLFLDGYRKGRAEEIPKPSLSEISKAAGAVWRDMSVADKDDFNTNAKKGNEERRLEFEATQANADPPIEPETTVTEDAKPAKKARVSKKSATPPSNSVVSGWCIFRKEMSEKHSNMDVAALSQETENAWNAMTEAEKTPYFEKAKATNEDTKAKGKKAKDKKAKDKKAKDKKAKGKTSASDLPSTDVNVVDNNSPNLENPGGAPAGGETPTDEENLPGSKAKTKNKAKPKPKNTSKARSKPKPKENDKANPPADSASQQGESNMDAQVPTAEKATDRTKSAKPKSRKRKAKDISGGGAVAK